MHRLSAIARKKNLARNAILPRLRALPSFGTLEQLLLRPPRQRAGCRDLTTLTCPIPVSKFLRLLNIFRMFSHLYLQKENAVFPTLCSYQESLLWCLTDISGVCQLHAFLEIWEVENGKEFSICQFLSTICRLKKKPFFSLSLTPRFYDSDLIVLFVFSAFQRHQTCLHPIRNKKVMSFGKFQFFLYFCLYP